jgi:Holliday junction resolvasome RuvABC endonuclease subunit
MTICALDLATKTGYASSASGVVTSGVFCCASKPKEPWGAKFLRFRGWLRDWLEQEKPDALAYEEVRRWSSGDAAKAYCGLRAVMLMECYIRSIPVEGYAVGTIKKQFAGSGKASKQDMIDAAIRTLGIYPADDNEADALAVMTLALSVRISDKNKTQCTPPQTPLSKKSSSPTASQTRRSLSTSG